MLSRVAAPSPVGPAPITSTSTSIRDICTYVLDTWLGRCVFFTTARVKMPEKWRPAERTRERAVSTWLARCDLAVPAYHSFRERACLCPEQDRHQYSWASSFMFDLRSRPIIINKEHTKKVQGPVSSHPVQSFVPGAGKHEHVREDAGNLDDPSRNVPRQRIDCKKLPSQR